MATLKQINASRSNGARSRGPVTPEGKARVSQNGTTHGIYTNRVVLQNEDPAAYQLLREALLRDWTPMSSFEHALIIDIADARWRLARFTTLETAALDFEVERMRPEVEETFEQIDEATRTVLAFNALLIHNHTFTVLQNAIRQQHRIIDRATSQLLRLRKIRPDQDNGPGTTAPKPTESNEIQPNIRTKPEPPPPTGPNAPAAHTRPRIYASAIRRNYPQRAPKVRRLAA